MMAKKKQVMKKGGMAKKRGGGMIKKRGGGMLQKKMVCGMMNVSPRKALAMGAKPMKGGGKVMKGKKKKAKKAKKRG